MEKANVTKIEDFRLFIGKKLLLRRKIKDSDPEVTNKWLVTITDYKQDMGTTTVSYDFIRLNGYNLRMTQNSSSITSFPNGAFNNRMFLLNKEDIDNLMAEVFAEEL